MVSNDATDTPSMSPEVRMRLSIAVSVLVLLAVGLCALLILRPSPPFPTPTPSTPPPPPPTFTATVPPAPTGTRGPAATYTPTPSPTPIPIPTWRKLGHLTTFEYVGNVVVEEKGSSTIWGADYVLLEVWGKVQAGVDMTQIKDSDVVVDGTSVELVLPPVTVNSVEPVYDQIHAYIDRQKILSSEFSDVQIRALEKAQAQLRAQILGNESWIALVEEVTRLRLEIFLRQLGFEDVKIVFKKSSVR